MAAASYYDAGPRPPLQQHSSSLYPPARPQRASSQPNLPYPILQQNGSPGQPQPQAQADYSQNPPPAYHPFNNEQPKPSVHFAPTPTPSLSQQRPSNPSQPRPDPYSFNNPNYQTSQSQQFAPYQQQYIPQNYQYQPQQQQQQQQPPQQSLSSHQYRPSSHHRYSDVSPHGGYASDPERHRRKHKTRGRRVSDNSRSTKADGLLGAAGGGLIGDMIFPGLGTVGGALVGWVGGKDYGKHRKWREEKRDREQERWERKYRNSHDRSTSHSRDRDRDRDRGRDREWDRERDKRRGSHDRRREYD